MSIDIDQLSRQELVALNHRIVERLKMLDTLDTHQSMMAFHPGARVSFASTSGERLTGTLMKFNKKTVTVITDDGQRYVGSSMAGTCRPFASGIEFPTRRSIGWFLGRRERGS